MSLLPHLTEKLDLNMTFLPGRIFESSSQNILLCQCLVAQLFVVGVGNLRGTVNHITIFLLTYVTIKVQIDKVRHFKARSLLTGYPTGTYSEKGDT